MKKLTAAVCLMMAAASLVMSGFLCVTELRRRRERKAEAAVDRAMEEESRRSRAMDEGFDNLMRYAVNGQDGFGGQ